jgi:hypothetical protein
MREPVIHRDHGPGTRFLFSLTQGEGIELDDDGKRVVHVVTKITRRGEGPRERRTVGIVRHDDARMSAARDGSEARDLKEPSAEVLRKANCRKVLLTPLGEMRNAND